MSADKNKGGGFEQWATIFNLKQSAKTLIFLKGQGIESYEELLEKSAAVSSEFSGLSTKIKAADSRMKEITALQYQLGHYRKTKEVFKQYKTSGWSQKFYDQHETDIILHRAAKKYFNDNGYGKDKKLPKMDALKQEWATFNAEKKKLYSGYKELKERRNALWTARSNVEHVIGINKPAHQLDGFRKKSNGYSHEI